MALSKPGRQLVWILVSLALLAAALAAGWRYAIDNSAVALLDGADRIIGGTAGTRLALADGHYGPLGAQRIEVMAPDPPRAAPRPVLVFIHGGGWHSGTPGDYRFVGRAFARRGFVVALAGYCMVPQGTYPHMLEDSAAALAWVRQHIGAYGGDAAQVFVMGHSAGAYNAAMLALDPRWLRAAGVPDGFVKGVIGLSGPYDFYPFTSQSARDAFGHVSDPAQTQPIRFAHAGAPPMLLITGDEDTTVKPRNTTALAKALSDAGEPTVPVILRGVDHAGTVMKLAQPFARDSRVIAPVLAFLAAHGAASAPVQPAAR